MRIEKQRTRTKINEESTKFTKIMFTLLKWVDKITLVPTIATLSSLIYFFSFSLQDNESFFIIFIVFKKKNLSIFKGMDIL